MGRQVKKKARSFSLTDEEFDELLARSIHHGFVDRNEYLLALIEADQTHGFEAVLDTTKRKVLRASGGHDGVGQTLTASDKAGRALSRKARRRD